MLRTKFAVRLVAIDLFRHQKEWRGGIVETTNRLFGSRNLVSAGKVDAQNATEFAHGGRCGGVIGLGFGYSFFY